MSEQREHQPVGRRTYRIAGFRDRLAAPVTASAHVDDLIPGFALGALDPEETAAVDAHTRICPSCDRALTDARRTVGMLPFIVPLHVPPADSKAALFARVAHARKAATAAALPTTQLESLRTPTLPSSGGTMFAAATAVSAPPPAERSGGRSSWLISIVSVPLLIALIATGLWGMQLRDQLALQNSQVAELQAELANFGSGSTSYQLSPGAAAPQAEGQIVMGADERAGMLQIDVNTQEGPKQYQLLVNVDDQLVPAAEVTVDENGKGLARFELDQPFSEYESVQIKAVPVGTENPQSETLFLDNGGSLGSTGSGLGTGP